MSCIYLSRCVCAEPGSLLLQVPDGSGNPTGTERVNISGWGHRASALPGVSQPLRAICVQHDVPGGRHQPAAVSLLGTSETPAPTQTLLLGSFSFLQAAEPRVSLFSQEARERPGMSETEPQVVPCPPLPENYSYQTHPRGRDSKCMQPCIYCIYLSYNLFIESS